MFPARRPLSIFLLIVLFISLGVDLHAESVPASSVRPSSIFVGLRQQHESVQLEKDQARRDWEKRYQDILSRMKKAKSSILSGSLFLGGSIVCLLLSLKTKTTGGGTIGSWGTDPFGRPTWVGFDFPTIRYYEMNSIGLVVSISLLSVGAILVFSGRAKKKKAQKELAEMDQEAKLKGYGRLVIDPNQRLFGFALGFEF